MTRLFRQFKDRVARFLPDALRREDGTATMEFVLVVPIIIAIFMASFEGGLLMIRSIMLEMSVDMTMRELRLGHYPDADNHLLKKEICVRSIIFVDCVHSMKIELKRVSTTDWNMPAEKLKCVNRVQAIVPAVNAVIVGQNDLMLIRVCVTQDAMFPSTGIGLNLELDDEGGYALVARSAFVVEPI